MRPAHGVAECAAQVVRHVEPELRVEGQAAQQVVVVARLELEARVLRRVGDPLRVVAVELRERGAAERAGDGDEVVHDRDHVELAGHRVDVVP